MNQEIRNLNIEIARQSSVVRYGHSKYIMAETIRGIAGLAIVVGLATWYPTGLIIAALALFSTYTANKNLKRVYSQLQTEEKKLVDLQTQLANIHVEHRVQAVPHDPN